jgi:hypothetical protein
MDRIVTEKTTIVDLVPQGYTFSEMKLFKNDTNGQIVVVFEKKQDKTLDDYEREFQEGLYEFTSKLRDFYPKLYYTHILQMIADDICEKGIKRDYYISKNDLGIMVLNFPDVGSIGFDTEEHAEQAQKLMGTTLKLLI